MYALAMAGSALSGGEGALGLLLVGWVALRQLQPVVLRQAQPGDPVAGTVGFGGGEHRVGLYDPWLRGSAGPAAVFLRTGRGRMPPVFWFREINRGNGRKSAKLDKIETLQDRF